MRTVNVAELGNHLSAWLHQVRAGEELLLRDRNLPIARIVPLGENDIELDELSLVASAQMTPAGKRLDVDRFWAIGGARKNRWLGQAIQRTLEAERKEANAGLLGHKRHPPHLRSWSGK